MSTLRDDIERSINANCAECGSNTPDFILAEYLLACLAAFDAAVQARAKWYSRMDVPGIGAITGYGASLSAPPPSATAAPAEEEKCGLCAGSGRLPILDLATLTASGESVCSECGGSGRAPSSGEVG